MGSLTYKIIVDSFYYETDPQFSTSHDFKVAKILANELLEIYLTNRLHELERREQRKRVKNGFMGKVLRWDGDEKGVGGTYLRTGRLRLSEQGNG